jgi:metal-responsive CopG/Arc/MetJ family transcriptional regulator
MYDASRAAPSGNMIDLDACVEEQLIQSRDSLPRTALAQYVKSTRWFARVNATKKPAVASA